MFKFSNRFVIGWRPTDPENNFVVVDLAKFFKVAFNLASASNIFQIFFFLDVLI